MRISPYIDQVDRIIRDLLPYFFRKGTEIHHLLQAKWPVPLLLAEVQYYAEHRNQVIFSAKAGEIFRPTQIFLPLMFPPDPALLLIIERRVPVQHFQRHGVVDIALLLDGKQHHLYAEPDFPHQIFGNNPYINDIVFIF